MLPNPSPPFGPDHARLAFGRVVDRDPARLTVTVDLPQHKITTRHLRVVTGMAYGAQSFALPRLGDDVAVLMDRALNNGVCLGALYSATSDAHAPPNNGRANVIHLTADDGTVIEHDPDQVHTLVTVPAGGTITARVGNSSLVITDQSVVITSGGTQQTWTPDGVTGVAPAVDWSPS